MRVIGLTAQEQSEIFKLLAVILWLGNIQFSELDDGNAQIEDRSVTDFVGYLMEADGDLVMKVMTSKVVETQRGGRRGISFPLSIYLFIELRLHILRIGLRCAAQCRPSYIWSRRSCEGDLQQPIRLDRITCKHLYGPEKCT